VRSLILYQLKTETAALFNDVDPETKSVLVVEHSHLSFFFSPGAQSHSLTAVSPETKSVLVTTTLVIVLATIFIFGGGTAPLLELVIIFYLYGSVCWEYVYMYIHIYVCIYIYITLHVCMYARLLRQRLSLSWQLFSFLAAVPRPSSSWYVCFQVFGCVCIYMHICMYVYIYVLHCMCICAHACNNSTCHCLGNYFHFWRRNCAPSRVDIYGSTLIEGTHPPGGGFVCLCVYMYTFVSTYA